MSRSDLVDISCIIRHETSKAWLIDYGAKEPVWIPKSQGEFAANPNRDDGSGEMTLPEWLAQEKGLI